MIRKLSCRTIAGDSGRGKKAEEVWDGDELVRTRESNVDAAEPLSCTAAVAAFKGKSEKIEPPPENKKKKKKDERVEHAVLPAGRTGRHAWSDGSSCLASYFPPLERATRPLLAPEPRCVCQRQSLGLPSWTQLGALAVVLSCEGRALVVREVEPSSVRGFSDGRFQISLGDQISPEAVRVGFQERRERRDVAGRDVGGAGGTEGEAAGGRA